MSQLDLFTFTSDDTPALPLARVHGVNPAAYHRDDCHWITTEPMPGYVLSLGFARDTDGWRMAAGYHFPDIGSIGPVFVRSNVYASYQEARRAGLERLRLMVNGLQLSFSISPDKAERLRRAIHELTQAAQCGLSLFKDAA